MGKDDKFVLSVYEGDYGLASLHIESLQSILYTAIANVPKQVRVLNNLKYCLIYSAPSLTHGKLIVKSFSDIILYLRTLNYNIDHELSAKQSSETVAMINFVSTNLKPVVEFVYWLDQRNCDGFTNLWHMKALPLPFNYMHTRRCKSNATALIESVYPTETDMEVVKEFLSNKATKCLSDLSIRLGSSDYYYGSTPTTLDVIVYSYIAPLIKLPFPSKEITNLVSLWPNLINFVKRMDNAYFPNISKEPKYLKKQEKSSTGDDDVSYLAVLLFTLSATSLLLGFAFSRGIISVKMN